MTPIEDVNTQQQQLLPQQRQKQKAQDRKKDANNNSNGDTVLPTYNNNSTSNGNNNFTRLGRRMFSVGRFRFQFNHTRLFDAGLDCLNDFFESFVWYIGPLLIVFALSITALLVHTFATILVPMMQLKYANSPYKSIILGSHLTWVAFVVTNVLFNYAMCVMTRNTGPHYEKVVREMAFVTDFVYPETPAQLEMYKDEFEHKIVIRIRKRREREAADAAANNNNLSSAPSSSNTGMTQRRSTTTTVNNSTTTTTSTAAASTNLSSVVPSPAPIRHWMLMGPYEWGFCSTSNQPKPPRSHYDHVTKALVLNLDHYCPWMFNSIGYFNYRYFVSFMLYVLIGMMYGACISFESFQLLGSDAYRDFLRKERVLNARLPRPTPMMPYREEKLQISLSFMLCIAVGAALVILSGFHLYLTLTSQTTIEFQANWSSKWKARKQGRVFKNPYDLGWKRNWQQVYGTSCWLIAMLPSRREPEFLPVPIPGKNTRRKVDLKGHGSGEEIV